MSPTAPPAIAQPASERVNVPAAARIAGRLDHLTARVRPRHVLVPSLSVLVIAALVTLLLPSGPRPARVFAAQSEPVAAGATGAGSGDPLAAVQPTAAVTPTLGPDDPATLTGYIWPLPAGRITLPFGPTDWGTFRVDGQLFHDGLDMATFCGDRVVAAHSGTVLAAGRHFDDYMGWIGDLKPYYDRLDRLHAWNDLPITVVIDDGNGYRSMYAHFFEVTVKPGQTVQAGDLIGYEGDTGHATGCHVHYGLFSPLEAAEVALDPKIAQHMSLPGWETARVNPLLVLPWRWDVSEMKGLRTPPPGATPPPTPSPSPSKSPKPSAGH